MTNKNKVVWSEGLFLRPQHLQQQDSYIEWLSRRNLDAAPLQHFGFLKLELDNAALEAGMIGVEIAEGVMPDGTILSLPATTVDVAPMPVTSDTESGLVSIAVSTEHAGAALIDPHHSEPSGTRYRGALVEARDVVRGGAEPSKIEVAKLAPRLLMPGDETGGYTTLPVARVIGLTSEGAVALDPEFIPPALVTSAVKWYSGLLKELVTGIDRIIEAHGSMVLGGSGASMENLLILDLANTARPRVAHLLAQDNFHPSHLFLELSSLAGKMATYGASARRLAEQEAYDHGDPQLAFQALADTLRTLVLSLRHVEPKSRALHVSRHSDNIWTVRIDNPQIVENSRLVLRVGGDMSERLLRKLFVDQATVGAADEFDALWKSRLTGIPLKPLHSQPREIPYDGERLCLELDRTSEHWASLTGAPGFVLGVAGKLEKEPEIDCYAVSR